MQNKEIKQQIEKTFKYSNSNDDLFDNFRIAINQKINDLDMYIALLWNKTLSADEIAMYAEKICREFPEFCLQVYLNIAEIFDSSSSYGKYKEKSFEYIKKAANYDSSSAEPYIAISKMYNRELDLPKFESVIEFIEDGLKSVKVKSKLYFTLAKLYAKNGEIAKGKGYQAKGEEFLEKGY